VSDAGFDEQARLVIVRAETVMAHQRGAQRRLRRREAKQPLLVMTKYEIDIPRAEPALTIENDQRLVVGKVRNGRVVTIAMDGAHTFPCLGR